MRLKFFTLIFAVGMMAIAPVRLTYPFTLEEIVSIVGLAESVPDIDAAWVSASGLCSLQRNDSKSEFRAVASESRMDRFHAASITKLLTATVIMQLRDEGLLSLEDPVAHYEPSFSGSPILIKHLLTHTSGLRDRKRAKGRTTKAEVDAYIHSLSRQKIKITPGSEWRYVDAGFNLLGRVIEAVTDRSYGEAITDRILVPLAMRNSSFMLADNTEARPVPAYNKRGKPQEHPWDLAFLPSSGLQTTASDLALFAGMVLNVFQNRRSPVSSPETLMEMTTARIVTDWPGIMQGYGWQLATTDQGNQWRRAGSEAGFEGLLTVYPDPGFGIVVLGNRQDWPRFELEREIRLRLLEEAEICAAG